MQDYKKLIGSKIKKRRVERGYPTQEALAAAIGVQQSQVARWETGKHMPEGGHRRALAEILDVDDTFFQTVNAPVDDLLSQNKEADKKIEALLETLTSEIKKRQFTNPQREELFNILAQLPDNLLIDAITDLRSLVAASLASDEDEIGPLSRRK